MRQCSIVFFAVFTLNIWSQDNDKQIEFRLDNDKFIFQDRYYTSGLFLSYKTRLKNDFIFKKEDSSSLQLNVTLGNETYTPTDLSSLDSERFDRPFAGWFFIRAEVAKFRKKSSVSWALEGGITGEESLSGSLQLAFHDLLNLGNRPTWAEQIGFKVLFNLKFKFVRNWQLNQNNALQFQTQPTIGTKDIFLVNTIKYVFGKFNVFENSSVNGVINNAPKEFFGFISLGHKYVIHNTILQGGITRDETTFTASPTRNVFNLSAGTVLKLKRNIFKFGFTFNTKETALSETHGYGSFTYGRSF